MLTPIEYIALTFLGAAAIAGGAGILQRAIAALRAARRNKG